MNYGFGSTNAPVLFNEALHDLNPIQVIKIANQ